MKTSQEKKKKYEKLQKILENMKKTSCEKKQGEKNTFEKQNSSFQRDRCKLIALSRTEPIRSEPYRNVCNATDDNSDKPTNQQQQQLIFLNTSSNVVTSVFLSIP